MIVKMSRVEIIGLKERLHQIIQFLHTLGCLQIDDIRECPDVNVPSFSPPESMKVEREELDLLIANINGMMDIFSQISRIQDESYMDGNKASYSQIKKYVAEITENVQFINNRKKTLQDELATLSKYTEILRIIQPHTPDSSKDYGNATIRALVHSSQSSTMKHLARQLQTITNGKFEMVTAKVSDETEAVIGVFPLELISQVDAFMKNEKITQLVLPEEYTSLTTDEALHQIENKVSLNHRELDKNKTEMQQLADKWLPHLQIWQLICMDNVDENEVYLKTGETDYTFTIFGWVPQNEFQKLSTALKKEFTKEISVRQVRIPKELRSRIPVKTINPKSVEPFEHFVKMRATPSYTDIDPSTLVAIFMPLFFGMMAGDVGYGIIMMIIALLLGKKVKKGLLADIMKFLRSGAIWTIVFGVIYGEYFGTIGEEFGLKPLWINRSEPTSIFPLLGMAIAVGMVHLMFGLIIGVWNAYNNNDREHLIERSGMFIGLVGLLLLIGSFSGFLPGVFTVIGWVVFASGLVAIAISMGKTGVFLGPIEFVSLIGNILSYLRIAALGLASVFLAKVANDVGRMIPSVFVGILFAVIIHALNIVMGILSPTIQSLRLQYVEFFGRFYEGGQSPFEPFTQRVSVKNTGY